MKKVNLIKDKDGNVSFEETPLGKYLLTGRDEISEELEKRHNVTTARIDEFAQYSGFIGFDPISKKVKTKSAKISKKK